MEIKVSLARLQVQWHPFLVGTDHTNSAGILGLQVVEESRRGIPVVCVEHTSLVEQLCLLHQVNDGHSAYGELPAILPQVDLCTLSQDHQMNRACSTLQVPQGLVLAPISITFFINILG